MKVKCNCAYLFQPKSYMYILANMLRREKKYHATLFLRQPFKENHKINTSKLMRFRKYI